MGRRGFLSLVGAAVALLLSASAALAAKPTLQSASSGNVTATYSFRGTPPKVSDERLKIVRAGQQLYNQPVTSTACAPSGCDPGTLTGSSVKVADIEADGQPDVILSLFTGGNGCCQLEQVFRFDQSRNTYVKAERNFGQGALLKQLSGRWRFVSSDQAFACAFTDCAASGQPLQIWSFTSGAFHNVTRHYRAMIRADAAKWWRIFTHHISNGVGFIAAWAADQELLGHNRKVQSTLATQARRGRLRDDHMGLATGKRFVRQLNALLRKLGYEH